MCKKKKDGGTRTAFHSPPLFLLHKTEAEGKEASFGTTCNSCGKKKENISSTLSIPASAKEFHSLFFPFSGEGFHPQEEHKGWRV